MVNLIKHDWTHSLVSLSNNVKYFLVKETIFSNYNILIRWMETKAISSYIVPLIHSLIFIWESNANPKSQLWNFQDPNNRKFGTYQIIILILCLCCDVKKRRLSNVHHDPIWIHIHTCTQWKTASDVSSRNSNYFWWLRWREILILFFICIFSFYTDMNSLRNF